MACCLEQTPVSRGDRRSSGEEEGWNDMSSFRRVGEKAGGRTRTADLLITNQMLYQLSYTGMEAILYPGKGLDATRSQASDRAAAASSGSTVLMRQPVACSKPPVPVSTGRISTNQWRQGAPSPWKGALWITT